MPKWWHVEATFNRLHRVRPRRWLPRGTSEFRVGVGRFVFALTARWKKGICAVGRFRRTMCPLSDPHALTWRYPSMKKKVSKVSDTGGAKHLAAMETVRFADLLPLVEHCAMRQYDDGDPREPGWVTIKTQGAAWCVQVKDPDAAVSFTAVAETLDKALETAALLLACDDAPWEQDRWLAQQRASGKKK